MSNEAPAAPKVRLLPLVVLGAALGIPAALVAAAFLGLVSWLESWLWSDLPAHLGQSEPPAWLVVLLPAVGGVVVWVARRFLPGDGGHRPLDGLGHGAVPIRYAPGIVLAALGTLAFGAVLGPEAPLIALGSVVGMLFTRRVKNNPPAQEVLATAGSFSAVSAVFGGPLVAGTLMLEAGIAAGSKLIPALLPGFVAAAVGYVLFIGLGSWTGIPATPLSVGDLPLYSGTSVLDLVLAILVGLLVSLIVAAVRRLAVPVDHSVGPGTGTRLLVALVLGGVAVGVIALAARALGDDSQDVLFSGQQAIPALVGLTSAGAVLLLIVAKGLGYAISLGTGFRGGPVFPAIFLGIAVAMLAVVFLDTSPTWAVAVGAAAGMTAGTGLLFSGMLFSMLLVGHNGIDALPAAVLAAAAAWLTRAALAQRERA